MRECKVCNSSGKCHRCKGSGYIGDGQTKGLVSCPNCGDGSFCGYRNPHTGNAVMDSYTNIGDGICKVCGGKGFFQVLI